MKGVFSNVVGYRANALMFDLGGAFIHPYQDLKIGLLIKNIGFLLSDYSQTSSTTLPFDIQSGVTYKPEHMPFHFSFTAHYLTSFNILYHNPADGSEKPNALDKALQHFNFGVELLIHKHVNLLVGFNSLKHKELKLENVGGGSGLSFGFLIHIKSMEMAVSRTDYVTGGSYQISLSANIEKLVTSK